MKKEITKARIGLIVAGMRAETLQVTALVVCGLLAAIVVMILITAAEQHWHQPFSEIIRAAPRGFFAWFDSWR